MALDGAFLYAVRNELLPLIGGRVEKIHQPSREEVIISIRTRSGSKKLYISANAGSARVHITENSVDNPQTPPMFCMLLRKRLGSGKLIDIRQDGLERILFLDFECVNELGDIVTITLACEIMGRCSNLVIISDEGKVIDSIKRVDEDMSRERLVLPGMKYTMPPRDDRLNFLTAEPDEIVSRLRSTEPKELSKALIRIFEGISPILAREWAFFAGRGAHLESDTIDGDQLDRLLFVIKRTKGQLENGECCFSSVSDKEGQLKDFSFIRLSQFGTLMYTKEIPTASELLDYFYSERDRAARTKQRANDLFKLLMNLTERTSRRIAAQREELAACADKDKAKLYGDLISANMYRIQKGDSSATVEDFYDESCPNITIELDVRKTPAQNAQHYYSEYKKSVTAEEKLAVQIQKGEEELQYLESVFDSLTRASSENDIIQLRLELREQGYIRYAGGKAKPPKALPPIEYKSSDGFSILVGRNNKQNDQLSLKFAEKSDIWLHTQLITGSHVLILTDGATPPDKTIEEAAIIAAVNSSGRNSGLVPVDYCLAKFVKKPAGAKPGKVIFTNYKTAFVKPDAELEQSLRV
ncbi:NFACT family protein [Ruminococcus flavefaciens]|uniref:Rqc2 family fibronectin-binding protein n=1 Tax=Ruminococcus flavefaciens TaxID=1265 RepID=UPI0026E9BFF9|nr:NFACT RNA binding domain-containing protein [Ruminococcus flavefaciens]MDD7517537.1 NFACT RNA binding domain-containing protein [Ruminococcus flavefaciens]MDY5691508.1 NFACT RNA binding domain-containing protein [Ruminococcus flavefaciens]